MSLVVGDFRYKILVKESTGSTNEYGEEIESWITKHTLLAAKKYLSGSKSINNNEIFTSVQLQFITHYRTIDEKMRIECDGITYMINNIAEIGYREGLQITVEKIND
jgi:SPP1 family predicted phage head-tail adaptor